VRTQITNVRPPTGSIENELSPCGSRQVEGTTDRGGQKLCDCSGADDCARLSHPLENSARLGLDLGRRVKLIGTSLSGVKDDNHVDVADVPERELTDDRVRDVDRCSRLGWLAGR
jgi:hypothetical protein